MPGKAELSVQNKGGDADGQEKKLKVIKLQVHRIMVPHILFLNIIYFP